MQFSYIIQPKVNSPWILRTRKAGVQVDERRKGQILEATCSHTIQAQILGCSIHTRTIDSTAQWLRALMTYPMVNPDVIFQMHDLAPVASSLCSSIPQVQNLYLLTCQGCHNKRPQIGQLKFWSLKFKIKVLPSTCVLTWPFLFALASLASLSPKDASPLPLVPHLYDLI